MSFSPDDAVLVVHAGGKQCAIDLRQVAEIRGSESVHAAGLVPSSRGFVQRNGVRVPVYDLRAFLGTPMASAAEAVVVLDLPDRIAAVMVDAVCDVRIAKNRLPAAAAETVDGATDAFAWVAAWEGGQAPVLDVTSWLRACEANRAE
ncbi:MAG: chemotaxis protein CheW [Burkholderiales bacterium]